MIRVSFAFLEYVSALKKEYSARFDKSKPYYLLESLQRPPYSTTGWIMKDFVLKCR
jgi:hypothetical protein